MWSAHHVQISLWDDRLQFLSLFPVYDSLHDHVDGAGDVFLEQSVQTVLLLWPKFVLIS